jgi:LuxR family maltose regulon positive regulatory protein
MREVLSWMEEAPDENEEFCTMERMRYLTKARVYLQQGRSERALGILEQLLYYAETMHRPYIEMEVHLLMAITKERLGRKDWQEELQTCITMAEGYHFVRLISREGNVFLKLLKQGQFMWKDREFKRQVVEECEKMAAFYPSYLKQRGGEHITLSANAIKILRLQADGYSTDKIAKTLGITVSTVKYHNQETYKKLGVTSKTAAVNEARNRNLL